MPYDPQENLERLTKELAEHRGQDIGCNTRYEGTIDISTQFASRVPLGHARNSAIFESNWTSRKIISRREFFGAVIPLRKDGTPQDEVILGTDNDVFTYAGPLRYPQSGPCGIFFAPDLEAVFPRPLTATPFDSGGLVRKLTNNENLPPTEFLRLHEMPGPAYRTYLASLVATAFSGPTRYLEDSGPLCEAPMCVQGGDGRRWTFEVRFAKMIELAEDAPVVAVFLPEVIAQEPWAKELTAHYRRKGALIKTYTVDDGTDWEVLKRLSVEFLMNLLSKAS